MADDASSRFLRWAFRDQRGRVFIVSFKGAPGDVPGYAWHAERADVLARGGQWPPAVENNNYFCVSLFRGTRRQEVDFESLWVLAIDDVGDVSAGAGGECKVDPGVLLDRLGAPGWVWETSPGNQQWFYRFRVPVVDAKLAKLLLLMVRTAGDTTKSQDVKTVTRLMRLPVGTNGKKAYLPDGYVTRVVFEPTTGGPDDEVGTIDDPEGLLASWDAAEVAGGGVATADVPAAAAAAVAGSSGLGKRVGKSVVDLIGDDPVGRKLLELGRVKGLIPSKLGVEVVCPWEDEHTVKSETGAAYFPEKGGFECHHGHCQGRGYRELRAWLEEYLDQSGLWDGGVFGDLFSPVAGGDGDGGDDDPPLYREKVIDQYVFVKSEGRYLDRPSLALISVDTFNATERKGLKQWLAYQDGKTTKFMAPHAWYCGIGEGRIATVQSYWPGRGPVFEEGGVPMANLWQPVPRPLLGTRVDAGDVAPWLEIVEPICADEGPAVSEWLLDWFALMVGSTDIKPGWHPIIVSTVHGVGKDMMLWPVLECLGPRNVAKPSAGEITSGFNPFAQARMVSVTDLERNTRGSATAHDVYETIKPWTENTSRFVQINAKHRQPYSALNVSGWAITSNAGDAMALSESDRRFFVIMTRMQPMPRAWYAARSAWLKDEGGWQKVQEYLHRRWALITPERLARLLGHAPSTGGKVAMVLAAEDKLTAWTREQIEDGIWPDLMTSQDIQDAYERAGRRVLSTVPTAQKWGLILTKLGARRWHDGATIRGTSCGTSCGTSGGFIRMWIIRCLVQHDKMSMTEITDAYVRQNSFSQVPQI